MEEIRINKETDPELQTIKQNLAKGKWPGCLMHEDGSLRFQNRLCVPNNTEIKKYILEEAHNSHSLVHSSGTKMYRELR